MARVKHSVQVVLLVLLAGLPLTGPAFARNERLVVPMEEFLPAGTLAYVTVPDGDTLQGLLTRAGEDRTTLARRLVAGSDVAAESAATLLEIVQAAADGPVTWSLHHVGLPARPGAEAGGRRHFLLTFATRGKERNFDEVARDLVRGLLAPAFATQAKEEQLMGFPALHLSGKGPDLYVVSARGQLFLSSSALILGRVLKELTSPSGKTLAHRHEFIAARGWAGVTAKRQPHGFLWVNDPSFFPRPDLLDCRQATGLLLQEGEDFVDKLAVTVGPKSVLLRIDPGAAAPRAWAKGGEGGIWIGAALAAPTVQRLVAECVQVWQASIAEGIEEIAEGPVELLLRPGNAPLVRLVLREGVNREEAAARYQGHARIDGRVMIFCEDPRAVAAATAGDEAAEGKLAAVTAPQALLLPLLDRAGEGDGKSTSLLIAPFAQTADGGTVTVAAAPGAQGLFALILTSLTR
jgi:hypothetical protein